MGGEGKGEGIATVASRGVRAGAIAAVRGWAARAVARLAIGVALLGGIGIAQAAPVEREGMRYEDTARIDGSRVVLNGVGVRGGGLFKGYVAGLYLPEKESDAGQVLASKGAKRIAVRMLLGVNGELLAKTFGDGIRKNYPDAALDPLRERVDAFDAQVRAVGGVAKGDAIDLDYTPAGGTRLVVNGKRRGDAIPGDDFYAALLKMFIGERAVDKGLRAALLGQAP